MTRSLPCMLALAATACIDGNTMHQAEVVMTDSAGTSIVTTRGAGRTIHLDTTAINLTIGLDDGPEHLRFFRISDIQVDATDDIYVLDAGESKLRIFDSNGDYRHTIGGPGEGPGEFRSASGFLLAGDTVVMWDLSLRRVTRFLSNGMMLSTEAWRLPDGQEGWTYPIGRGPRGWIVANLRYAPDAEPGSYREDTVRITLVPFDGSPTTLDRAVTAFPFGRLYPITVDGVTGGFQPLGSQPPSYVADALGRVHVARTDSYSIDTFDSTGKHIRRIRRDHAPVPLDDQLVDRFRTAARMHWDTISRAGCTGCAVQLRRQLAKADLPHAEIIPPIGRIVVSASGALWVQRVDAVADPVQLLTSWTAPPMPPVWDRFDVHGAFVASYEFPRGFALHVASSDWLVGVTRDQFGVQRVARFELPQ